MGGARSSQVWVSVVLPGLSRGLGRWHGELGNSESDPNCYGDTSLNHCQFIGEARVTQVIFAAYCVLSLLKIDAADCLAGVPETVSSRGCSSTNHSDIPSYMDSTSRDLRRTVQAGCPPQPACPAGKRPCGVAVNANGCLVWSCC